MTSHVLITGRVAASDISWALNWRMDPSWPKPFPSVTLLEFVALPFRRIKLHGFCVPFKIVELEFVNQTARWFHRESELEWKTSEGWKMGNRRKRGKCNGLEPKL